MTITLTGETYNLTEDFNSENEDFYIYGYGVFNTNNFNISCRSFRINQPYNTQSLVNNMGSTTITTHGILNNEDIEYYPYTFLTGGYYITFNGENCILHTTYSGKYAIQIIKFTDNPHLEGSIKSVFIENGSKVYCFINGFNILDTLQVDGSNASMELVLRENSGDDGILVNNLIIRGTSENLITIYDNQSGPVETAKITANTTEISNVSVHDVLTAGPASPFDATNGGFLAENGINWYNYFDTWIFPTPQAIIF